MESETESWATSLLIQLNTVSTTKERLIRWFDWSRQGAVHEKTACMAFGNFISLLTRYAQSKAVILFEFVWIIVEKDQFK